MFVKFLEQHVPIDRVGDYASLLDRYVRKLEGSLTNVHQVTLDPSSVSGITIGVEDSSQLRVRASLDSGYEGFTENDEGYSFVGLSMNLEREDPVLFEVNVLGYLSHGDVDYYEFYRYGKLPNREQKIDKKRIDDYLEEKLKEEFPVLRDRGYALINTYKIDNSYGPSLFWTLPTEVKEPWVLPWQKIYHRAMELTKTMPEIFARGESL